MPAKWFEYPHFFAMARCTHHCFLRLECSWRSTMQADTNVAALIVSRLPAGAGCCRERLTVCVTFCVIVGDLLRAGGAPKQMQSAGEERFRW